MDIPTNIRTGFDSVNGEEVTLLQKKMIHAFIAVVWRRATTIGILYASHRDSMFNMKDFAKALKFCTLAPSGLAPKIKPFLTQIITEGLIEPEEYENEPHIKEAVRLCLSWSNDNDMRKEAYNYAFAIFHQDFDENSVEDCAEFDLELNEAGNDLLAAGIKSSDIDNEDHINCGNCACHFCETIASYNYKINPSLAKDPIDRIFLNSLVQLDTTA